MNYHKLSMITFSCMAVLAQSACAESYQPIGTPSSADRYFNQAERDASRGNMAQMANYQQQMAAGSLAMYPEYWQLNKNIDSQTPATVISFASRYPNTVMAEKLAADYAEAKARVGEYDAVRQVASYVTNPDASEACALALGFNHGGDSMRAYVEKANVWLNTDKKLPQLCQQLATELNSNPMTSNDDREQRLYRMLRTGNNGDIVQLASRLGVAISYSQLMSVSSNPNTFFSQLNTLPTTATNRYLYLYGLGQLAKKSVNEAAMQLNYDIGRSPQFFDTKTRQYAYRTLGVARMNVNTDQGFSTEAVDWMQKSVGVPFNFEEAEDYAQAAIRFGRWQDVVQAVGAMDYKTQQQPIWQYWLAKSYKMGGDNAQRQQANQIFSQLARSTDYYGLLAKDQIGQRFDQLPSTLAPANSDYTRLAQDSAFNRAFTLYNLSANPTYTNREWNWAVKQARDRGDNSMIVAAAKTATDLGWYDRAIYALETTKTIPNSALAFPMPHQSSVVQYSRQAGIDPAWAYGIMRQESRFNVGAKSGVGAGGLMQIMPATAQYIARKLGESYSPTRVATGDTNIRYGTYYMGDILNKLGGQPVLATAGYNAGPNKAKTWQPDNGSLAADQYVESIPYPETRDYVKAVMENATNYGVLLNSSHPSISERMGVIPSKY
jgi:soluble lytic murein transglycosylase